MGKIALMNIGPNPEATPEEREQGQAVFFTTVKVIEEIQRNIKTDVEKAQRLLSQAWNKHLLDYIDRVSGGAKDNPTIATAVATNVISLYFATNGDWDKMIKLATEAQKEIKDGA